MSRFDYVEDSFYLYAMELYNQTGHISTMAPKFINHASKEFIYFDNKSDVSFSFEQRSLLNDFSNVSHLFTVNDCVFLSLKLQTQKEDRSKKAHDIHSMIHSVINEKSSICLFKHHQQIMLTFIGYGYNCILSDWYDIDDELNSLSLKLDISNMSIIQNENYFLDIVYILARDYYLINKPSTYDVFPINYNSNFEYGVINKEELNEYIQNIITAQQRKYGNDYIEYDNAINYKADEISNELDMMLFDMESEANNQFDEDFEFIDEKENFDTDTDETHKDEYEFDNIDPEIFKDPELMVKWIEKMDN